MEYKLNKIMKNDLADGLEEVAKLKKCIFDGFRMNLLTRAKHVYTSTYKRVPVKIKSPYVTELSSKYADQTRPYAVIVDSYMLMAKMNSAQFEFIASGFVAVMDNYIPCTV
jgi:hypothetical protein